MKTFRLLDSGLFCSQVLQEQKRLMDSASEACVPWRAWACWGLWLPLGFPNYLGLTDQFNHMLGKVSFHWADVREDPGEERGRCTDCVGCWKLRDTWNPTGWGERSRSRFFFGKRETMRAVLTSKASD